MTAPAQTAVAGSVVAAQPTWLPVTVLLFSSTMWGLSWWPLKAFGEQGLSGPWVALLTYGLVGVAGLPWLWREHAQWRRQTGLLLLIALLGGWGNAAFVNAIVLGDVVRVMLLFYLAPVWSVIGGRLFLNESVSRRRLGAVILALCGAFLVIGGMAAFDAPPSVADLMAVTAGMGFAGNNIASRAAQSIPTASKSVSLFVGCGLASVAMLAASGSLLAAWPQPTLPTGLALAAYAFGGLVLVTATWQWSVTRLEAGRSGVIAIAELVVAIVSAALIAGERLSLHEWLGGALIVAAALIEATDTPNPAVPA
jgi:drug/metabolite transporter (DMT)-like permease